MLPTKAAYRVTDMSKFCLGPEV